MWPPLIIRKIFGSLTWNIPVKDPVLFLTFDDGPIPEVTPWVLDTLKKYNARATFFCIGDNVNKHPDVYQRIAEEGHTVGNHTFNHLNGWKTKTKEYFLNVEQCQDILKLKTTNRKPLFRPPHGKLTPSQFLILNSQFSIIMWDVLSKDWKQNLTSEDCFSIVKQKARPGSIIVFHDSLKAEARMKPALEKTLAYFSQKGFSFKAIN